MVSTFYYYFLITHATFSITKCTQRPTLHCQNNYFIRRRAPTPGTRPAAKRGGGRESTCSFPIFRRSRRPRSVGPSAASAHPHGRRRAHFFVPEHGRILARSHLQVHGHNAPKARLAALRNLYFTSSKNGVQARTTQTPTHRGKNKTQKRRNKTTNEKRALPA